MPKCDGSMGNPYYFTMPMFAPGMKESSFPTLVFIKIQPIISIIDNLIIDNNVTIGPRSYVIKSIKKNSYFSGNPARNHRDYIRQNVLISKLPEIYKKLFK